MAFPTIVNRSTIKQNTAADPQTVTGFTATTVGNLLVLAIALKTGATQSVSGVTGGGGTWSRIGSAGFVSGSSTRIEFWANSTADSSLTQVTVDLSSAVVESTVLYELGTSDMDLANIQSASGADSVSNTSWTAGPITPTAGDYLLIAAISDPSTQSLTTPSVSAGWSAALWNQGSSTVQGMMVSDQAVTADGSTAYTNIFTTNRSTTNGWEIVAIPGAGATPVSVSDSGTVSASESVAVSATLPISDLDTVVGTETISLSGTLAISDLDTVVGSDVVSIAATLPTSDAGTISIVESVSIVTTSFADVSDSGIIAATEAISLSGTLDISDSGSIAGSDVVTILGSLDLSDSGTIAGSDVIVPVADVQLSDSSTIVGADSLAVLTSVIVDLVDSGTIAASEAISVTSLLTLVDSDTIVGTETISIVAILPISDSGTVAVAETIAIAALMSLFDPVTTNMITNPGFETNTTGWTISGGSVISRVTTEHHSGVAALQVVCSGAGSGQGAIVSQTAKIITSVPMKWRFRIWAKGNGTVIPRNSFRDLSNVTFQNIDGPPVTLDPTNWQEIVFDAVVTNPSGIVVNPWILTNSAQAVTFFLDDADVQPANVVGITEGITQTAGVAISDSGTVTGADVAALTALLSLVDNDTIVATETILPASSVELTEIGTVTGIEVVDLIADMDLFDSDTIVGADAISVSGDSGVSLSDTGTITGVENISVSSLIGLSDIDTISSIESIDLAAILPVSDFGGISSSEIIQMFTSLSITDLGSILGLDLLDIITARIISDGGLIESIEELNQLSLMELLDSDFISITDILTVSTETVLIPQLPISLVEWSDPSPQIKIQVVEVSVVSASWQIPSSRILVRVRQPVLIDAIWEKVR